MGLAEGVIEGVGQVGAVKPRAEEAGKELRQAEEKMVADWRQRGETAVEVLGERFSLVGLQQETERAVKRRELSDEVGILVNAMRVIADRDEEQFREWLGGAGLTDVEAAAIRGIVGAIGSREDMVAASRDLAEVVGGRLRMFPGGEELERVIWQVGDEMKKEVDGSGGGNRDSFWGRGGEPATPQGPEEPKNDEEDKNEVEEVEGGNRVRQAIVRLKRGVVIGRKHPSSRVKGQPGSGLAGCFLAAATLACCASAVALGWWGMQKAESVAPKEEQIPEEFVGVGGSWNSARFLADYMFYSPEEVGEFPDSGHTAIDSFLKAYGLADSNKERRAYGDAMLEELKRQGLSYSEGIGPWQNIVGFDEVRLRQRLIEQGYSHEDIGDLVNWLKEYLALRDDLKNQTGYQPTFDDRLARSGGLRDQRSYIRSVARYRQHKG